MISIRKTTVSTIATALLGLGILSACGVNDAQLVASDTGQQTAATDSSVYIITNLGEAVQEPTSLQVDNSDLVVTINDLKWSNWGSDKATATGTMVRDSTMDGGEGAVFTYPVTVVVDGLRDSQDPAIYTHLVSTPTGDDEGASVEEYQLGTEAATADQAN